MSVLCGLDPLCVLLVLACILKEVGVCEQSKRNRCRPRTRVRFGIVNRHFQLQTSKVGPTEALYRVQLLAVRMASLIQPRSIVESGRVDDEHVAVPLAYGVSPPRWLGINRCRTAICKDLPPPVEGLEQDDCQAFHLRDLERGRFQRGFGNPGRQTAARGGAGTASTESLPSQRLRLRLKRVLSVGRPVLRQVLVRDGPALPKALRVPAWSERGSSPDSGQVRLPVGARRCRS